MRRLTPLLSALLILAGCVPAPGGIKAKVPATRGGQSPSVVKPTGNGAPVVPGTLPASPIPGVNTPPAIISDNGASLTGLVRIPASLIGKVKLIGNNGSSWRLLALEQAPLAGMTVRLLDAAGNPLAGPDGKALVATTDAQGQYGFAGIVPTQNVLVEVLLPESLGAVRAIAPKGAKTVDADLVSTLTTGYILDRYVKGQADAVATLQKLPADVEAATRAKAQTALEGGAAAVPETLTTERVVATVDAMRAKDSGFDAQMDTVQKLLIAAGVSNLGAGLPATEIYMLTMFETEIARDGTVYAHVANEQLLWRIGADGRLAAAAGNGERASDSAVSSRAGLKATEFALGYVWKLKLDALGRPLVSENNHGIWRLEPDGTVTELHSPAALEAAFGKGFLARGVDLRDDGTLVCLEDDVIWALPPGGAKVKLADAPRVRANDGLVELEEGKRWLLSGFGSLNEIQLGQAPVTHFAQDDARHMLASNGSTADTTLDKRGNYFYFAASDRKLHRRAPDGTDMVVADYPHATRYLSWIQEGQDGQTYVNDYVLTGNQGAVLRRLGTNGGADTILAGREGPPQGFSSDGRVPLLKPSGLDVAPDGTMWVTDAGAILEFPPGGTPRTLATAKTTIPALFFEIVDFTGVRRLENGRLVARALGKTNEHLLVQDADGAWSRGITYKRTYGNDWNVTMHAWDAAPDGTLVASVHNYNRTTNQEEVHVLRRRPDDANPTTLVPISAGFRTIAQLTFGTDGKLYMRAAKDYTSKPARYVIADDGTVTELPADTLVPEAVDAAGRVYEGDASTFTYGNMGDRRIRRQAPGGAPQVVAGQGTALLGGTALDDSIGWAEDLAFDAAGNLYIRDAVRRQVRRVPKDRL